MFLDQPGDTENAAAVAFPADHFEPILPFRHLGEQDHVPHTSPFAPLTVTRASSDMAIVLTDKPHIVIARAPRRIRKKPAGPKLTRIIVGPYEDELRPALPPEADAARTKPAAKPAAVIVGQRAGPTISEEEYKARGDAADRLFRDLVRRASKK
jgi:hypothetical protein